VDDSELDAALFATGVLVDKPRGMVGFAHPLFGQALYDDLDASTRRRLHARAFDVLVDRGLDAEAGEHAIRGDLAGERVVAALGRAGRASLRAGAVATAARQLEAAVSVARESASAPLRCALADALLTNGRVDEAIKLTSRALADTSLSWEERFALLRLQGRSLYLTGASDHGDEALAGAATLAEDHDAPDLAANSLLDQSLSSWLVGGPQRALPLAARARELAHRSGDGALCVRADATWGHLASESGNQEGFAATAAVSQRLWDGTLRIEASELVWPWAAVYHAAMDANYAESYQDAERIFTMAREAMEQAGAPNALATLAIYIANNVLRQGRIEDALAEAVSAREFAELTPGVIPYAEVVRAEALAWAGRLEESEAMCQAAERAAPGQWFVELWVAHVRGTRLLWQGDERAADELLVCERVTNSAGIREPCHTQWQDHAIEAYLAVDKRDDARRVIDWLEDCAKGLPCRWPRIAAATGRARLAEHEGHEDRARAEFQTALKLHDQLSLPLQHTEALLAYGIFERRSGNPTRARHPLAEALKLAERSGARWLADRAQSELALAGGRRRRDGATRDQLTAAESRVARLAGEGLSNAEIARRLHLSVNTIETHLKRVHRKLGLHSRRQLTALAATKDHGNPGR
jgi:DNA-binding CsgD family transcriptional regulator/Tfp pilus assembly protein PilF